jgi:hypothetical protein
VVTQARQVLQICFALCASTHMWETRLLHRSTHLGDVLYFNTVKRQERDADKMNEDGEGPMFPAGPLLNGQRAESVTAQVAIRLAPSAILSLPLAGH